VPVRLVPLPQREYEAVCARIDAGEPQSQDLRAATKHLLALLAAKAPGHSVEVRVPPYAAVQVVAGARHARGTPPAVVELDAQTWIALARGAVTWSDAAAQGRIHASGERSDLSQWLPVG